MKKLIIGMVLAVICSTKLEYTEGAKGADWTFGKKDKDMEALIKEALGESGAAHGDKVSSAILALEQTFMDVTDFDTEQTAQGAARSCCEKVRQFFAGVGEKVKATKLLTTAFDQAKAAIPQLGRHLATLVADPKLGNAGHTANILSGVTLCVEYMAVQTYAENALKSAWDDLTFSMTTMLETTTNAVEQVHRQLQDRNIVTELQRAIGIARQTVANARTRLGPEAQTQAPATYTAPAPAAYTAQPAYIAPGYSSAPVTPAPAYTAPAYPAATTAPTLKAGR
ncbi:MAG: hypothetical protein LBB25_04450 [Holosporaceae bacterium]|nr:hypothetical protein [Holosporaceae bacterium]